MIKRFVPVILVFMLVILSAGVFIDTAAATSYDPETPYVKIRNRATGLYADSMDLPAGSICRQSVGGNLLSHHWVIVPVTSAGNIIKIKSRNTGLYLDISKEIPNFVVLMKESSDYGQQWILERVQNYYRFRNCDNGLYIDGKSPSGASSQYLYLFTPDYRDSILWEIITVTN